MNQSRVKPTDKRKDGWTSPILHEPSGRGQGSNNLSSARDWWEYTKFYFKENDNIFSKNYVAQENITILRLQEDYKTYTKKKTINQKLNQ